MQKDFGKVDKMLGQIKKNAFFEVFLLPMNQVSYDFLTHQLTDLHFTNGVFEKAEKVMREFSAFIQVCQEDIKVYPSYKGYKRLREKSNLYRGHVYANFTTNTGWIYNSKKCF